MQATETKNINNLFFDGYYKEIWRALIPDALTTAEVDFLIERAALHSGSKVLDLMCGFGRHTVPLAQKGIHVTAIDNLEEYVTEINQAIKSENLPVNCVVADVIEYEPAEVYDLVICLGNNLSFFNQEDTRKLFSMIADHTKKGGLFIANSWTLAEMVFKNFTSRTWSEVKGYRYLVDNKFCFNPARIEIETTMISPEGAQEIKRAIDYVYSLNEMQTMLEASAFTLTEVWSIPGKKKFTLGDPRVYIVALKQ